MTRTAVARALYRRTSLPFRVAFRVAARWRAQSPRALPTAGDPYLVAHVDHFAVERGTYAYHRVWALLEHFRPPADPRTLRLLSLGPRSEIELYYLWLLFGFAWGNIVGLDLVSVSPKIVLGDLSRRLPFADQSFDVIVASAVLEKSRDPERTRDEIQRVARPGAHVLATGDGATARAEDTTIPVRLFAGGVGHYR